MLYFIELAFLRIIGGVFRALPRAATLAVGSQIGILVYLLASGRRRLALKNLEMALGDEYQPGELKIIARESFRNLGMNIAEYFEHPVLTADTLSNVVTFEGEDHLKGALGQGRGAFILSAHVGNFDLLGNALALRGYPMAIITKISRSRAVDKIWMEYRHSTSVKAFRGRGIMRESIRHLKGGGMVGFVLDQNARLTEGVFVPFFGKEACTLTSLAILARRTEAPVVPVYIHRIGKVHRVVIEEPIKYQSLPDQDDDLVERTRVYTQWTENVIRRHPDQWTWLHDRWKTRPIEESKA